MSHWTFKSFESTGVDTKSMLLFQRPLWSVEFHLVGTVWMGLCSGRLRSFWMPLSRCWARTEWWKWVAHFLCMAMTSVTAFWLARHIMHHKLQSMCRTAEVWQFSKPRSLHQLRSTVSKHKSLSSIPQAYPVMIVWCTYWYWIQLFNTTCSLVRSLTMMWHVRLICDSFEPDQHALTGGVVSILWLNQGLYLIHSLVVHLLQFLSA